MTLVQLLVGTALGLSVTAGLGMFFIQGSRSSREDINVANMLNELGYATGQLTADVEMAGFWARVHDPATIDRDGSLALAGADCGPAGWFKDLDSVAVLDNPTAAQVHAAHPCIAADDVVPGSDVIAIKRVLGRVAGTDTDSSGLTPGAIYLRTHERHGTLYLHGGGGPAIEAPYQDWQYVAAVYYVQKYSVSPGESPRVPSLCRQVLQPGAGAPAFAKECVAQGVENLQVEIGVDTDEDGGANFFTATPTAAQLAGASTARLYLQIRSARRDVDYRNEKTYQIGNAEPFTPAGDEVHYYRKTLTSEVALRNPRGLQGVAVQ